MKAVLVCNGSINELGIIRKYSARAQYLLGVDGGASHIIDSGLMPDAVFGDLDSIRNEHLDLLKSKEIKIFKYPTEKDFTDSTAALNFALHKGCREIVLLGATGTRLDHMLANILNLRNLALEGVNCLIADDNNEICAFTHSYERDIETLPFETRLVSLIPLTDEVTGVTTKGLKYMLFNADLSSKNPSHGVSNEIIDDMFSVEITGSGVLMLIISRD